MTVHTYHVEVADWGGLLIEIERMFGETQTMAAYSHKDAVITQLSRDKDSRIKIDRNSDAVYSQYNHAIKRIFKDNLRDEYSDFIKAFRVRVATGGKWRYYEVTAPKDPDYEREKQWFSIHYWDRDGRWAVSGDDIEAASFDEALHAQHDYHKKSILMWSGDHCKIYYLRKMNVDCFYKVEVRGYER